MKEKGIELLKKYLAKQGIKTVDELQGDEKTVFEGWRVILTKDKLDIDDVRNFCESQIGMIEAKWADLNLPQAKKSEFIPYHTVYKLLLAAIDAPKAQREALEKNLNQLINS